MSDPNKEFVLARYPTARARSIGPLRKRVSGASRKTFRVARSFVVDWPAPDMWRNLSEYEPTEAAAWASAAARIRKQEQQGQSNGA